MARIRNGILGGFSGKVGNVIGQCYEGVEIVRAYPKSVYNPKTISQENHRLAFSTLSGLIRTAYPLLRYSVSGGRAIDNPFNKSMRYNWDNAVHDNELVLDKLTFGEWYGQPFDNLECVKFDILQPAGKYIGFSITWESFVDDYYKFSDDQLLAVVVCERVGSGLFVSYFGNTGATRGADGNIGVVEIPAYPVDSLVDGDKFHLYLGVNSTDIVNSKDTTITIPAHNIPAFKPATTYTREYLRNRIRKLVDEIFHS